MSEENKKDLFGSHCRRAALSCLLIETIKGYLERNTELTIWVDVHQLEKTEKDMREGVKFSRGFLALINGPVKNNEAPDDDEAENAYFNRPFCILELEEALRSGIPVVPIIHPMDKLNIGKLIAGFPEHLREPIGSLEFIVLDRNDPEMFEVGMRKILRAVKLLPVPVSRPPSTPTPHGPDPLYKKKGLTLCPTSLAPTPCGPDLLPQPHSPIGTPAGPPLPPSRNPRTASVLISLPCWRERTWTTSGAASRRTTS